MRVLGMISGTSHDGIDAAVVDFQPDGAGLTGHVEHVSSTPYDPALRARLLAALPPASTTLAEVCELDTLVGQAFAEAAAAVVAAAGPVDLVCSHGQTVYHWVVGGTARGTLQIGQAAWIAEALGVPVVSDVRSRDIAAGGHGAPLVSVLDDLLLSGLAGVRGALNLGGISNITVLGPGGATAYDIGPANALIDAVVLERGLHPDGFDRGGAIAASGSVHTSLLDLLLAEPYYDLPAPKSTGKELFHGTYVADALARLGSAVADADLVATLTELTVRTVAAEVGRAGVTTLVVSGGGCRNATLLDGLRAALPEVAVLLSDDLGAPADHKEAIAFALIGWCTVHGVPGNVPTGTGARGPRVLGTITPGRDALVLPAPTSAPKGLTLRAGARAARSVAVRPARPDDLDEIVQVFLRCWRESYASVLPRAAVDAMTDARAQELWARAMSASAAGDLMVAVAPDGDHVIGMTRVLPVEGELGHVTSLYVSPAAQGAGVGRTLLTAAQDRLVAEGATHATLWVFEDNAPSIAFYRRLGWAPDGRRRTEEEFGAPELGMAAQLVADPQESR